MATENSLASELFTQIPHNTQFHIQQPKRAVIHGCQLMFVDRLRGHIYKRYFQWLFPTLRNWVWSSHITHVVIMILNLLHIDIVKARSVHLADSYIKPRMIGTLFSAYIHLQAGTKRGRLDRFAEESGDARQQRHSADRRHGAQEIQSGKDRRRSTASTRAKARNALPGMEKSRIMPSSLRAARTYFDAARRIRCVSGARRDRCFKRRLSNAAI